MLKSRSSYARIKLPSKNFKAQRWDTKTQAFTEVKSDIFEQQHYDSKGEVLADFEMYIPSEF